MARSTGANGIGLGTAEESQRMVEDIVDAVEIFGIVQIAAVMDDRADLLRSLDPAQMAGKAAGQQTMTAISRMNPCSGAQLEAQHRLCEARGIKARRRQQRMEGHG